MSQPDFHIHVSASKPAVFFLMAVVGAFALMLILSGLDRLSHAPLWEWGGQVLMGLGLIYVMERIWRYYFLPQVSVTATHLVIRPFWRGTTRWAYAETQAWRLTQQTIEKDWRHRPLAVPITVERLVREDRSGGEARVVLPGFAGQNFAMLHALAQRSGLHVVKV